MAARVTYIGNVKFEQAANPVWSKDFQGFDTARVPWQGAATKLNEFEDKLVQFSALPGYSRMFLTGWSNNDDKVFPTVDLHYIGFRGNTAPPVKIEDGKALQSVSTSIVPETGQFQEHIDPETEELIAGVQLTLEALYLSSRTTYTWLTYTKPELLPPYRTVRNKVDPLSGLISWKISGDGVEGSIDLGAFTALLNSLTRQELLSDYTVEDIVPDKLWACRACVDYVLTGT